MSFELSFPGLDDLDDLGELFKSTGEVVIRSVDLIEDVAEVFGGEGLDFPSDATISLSRTAPVLASGQSTTSPNLEIFFPGFPGELSIPFPSAIGGGVTVGPPPDTTNLLLLLGLAVVAVIVIMN